MWKALLKKQFLELINVYFPKKKAGKKRSAGAVVGFLILYALIQPPNPYRLIVLFACVLGMYLCCGFLWELFDVHDMSMRAWVLCGVFAFAEVGILQILSDVLGWSRRRVFHDEQRA